MARLGSDPEGIRLMEGKTRSYTFFASSLGVAAANILKQEMLSIGGEAAIARGTVNCSVEKSDAILHATVKQYGLLIEKLGYQPFGLVELAGEIERALKTVELGPESFEVRKVRIPQQKPRIMGILNITPDSFSDGGRYVEPEKAVARALEMVDQGASIIDVGAESTRPGSDPVSSEEEWRRLEPVLRQLRPLTDAVISVDTSKPPVARKSLENGADMINDITGGSDPAMLEAASEFDAPMVLMHMLGNPKNMQDNPHYDDVVSEVCTHLGMCARRAMDCGVKKIMLDPGIGFGKTPEHNLELIWSLDSIRSLGYPVVLGASRKSFIGTIPGGGNDTGAENRLEGSLAALSIGVARGADVLRVHDVAESARATAIAAAIRDGKP